MSKVEITFSGICVHVKELRCDPPKEALANGLMPVRPGTWAILPDCHHGRVLYNHTTTEPHHPRLCIRRHYVRSISASTPGLTRIDEDKGDYFVWKMKSVDLYVPQARGKLHEKLLDDLPSLTAQSDALSLELDRRVVAGGRAAARFAVFAGRIDLLKYHEAAMTTLTVKTEGPALLKMMRTCDDQIQGCIELKRHHDRNPQVFVANFAAEAEDDAADFHLNYDIVTRVPGVRTPTPEDLSRIRQARPEERADLESVFGADFGSGLGAGCSNSAYP